MSILFAGASHEPCQDLSCAGKGEGLKGAKSGLWFEYLRIISLARPRFVVIENVPALLSRGLDTVLGGLASLGYDAIWDCIPAKAVGAPHRRDRLFIIAWRVPDANRDGVREQPRRGVRSDRGDPSEPADDGPELADPESARLPGDGGTIRDGTELPGSSGDSHQWPPRPGDMRAWRKVPASIEPTVCGGSYGAPDRSHRLRALGNAVVPQVAEVIGHMLIEIKACLDSRK